jgi:hypothetical protein
MPQSPNIQKMSPEDAKDALRPILNMAYNHPVVATPYHLDVIDATGHIDDGVALMAFDIIALLHGKAPYINTLNNCAHNHNHPIRAAAAYRAMQRANDLTPFEQEIDYGSQSSDPLIAEAALRPVWVMSCLSNSIPPHLHPAIIRATGHPNDGVAIQALNTIQHAFDKKPFVSTILNCARDTQRPARAAQAYIAMKKAADLTPFHQEIDCGCKSANPLIAQAALEPIWFFLSAQHPPLPQVLQQTVIDATRHPDSQMAFRAAQVLKLLGPLSPASSSAPVTSPTKSDEKRQPVGVSVLKGVRLDFNVEANGSGPDLKFAQAEEALKASFAKFAANGHIKTEAWILYAPGNEHLEKTIIKVQFPQAQQEKIVLDSALHKAPVFTVTEYDDGTYSASLSGPSF